MPLDNSNLEPLDKFIIKAHSERMSVKENNARLKTRDDCVPFLGRNKVG